MNFASLDKTWVIAEIGVNHEGDPAKAADMIRLAAQAGADAVKFQTFTAEHYVSTVQPERRARVRRFQLSHQDFRSLAALARECGVTFFSTPLHSSDVDLLVQLAPIVKVSSGDLTHLPLIRDIARRGLPMIVSTGLGTKEEIAAAVATIERERPGIRAEGGLLLMHCIAAYPAPREDANLRNISWLKDNFGYPVGYSDHTFGIKTCELAVAAGAVALEKHFTYRREGQDFHDHKLSAEPAELKQMIEAVREAELLLGRYERHLGAAELANLTNMRRSLGAARDLSPGMELAEPDIELLRPQWAFRPDQISGVVGRKLARTVAAGDLFKEEDFA